MLNYYFKSFSAVAIASIIPVIIGSIFLSASFYMNVLLIQGIRNVRSLIP